MPSEWQDYGWDDVFFGDRHFDQPRPRRHFDQVKRVEKSPKVKQYYTTILLSPCLLQSIFSLSLYSLILISTKALSNSAIQPSVFSQNSQLSLLFVFILFLFIYRCYNMLYLTILLIFLVHFFRTTSKRISRLRSRWRCLVSCFLQGKTTFPGDSSGFSNPLNDGTSLRFEWQYGVGTWQG